MRDENLGRREPVHPTRERRPVSIAGALALTLGGRGRRRVADNCDVFLFLFALFHQMGEAAPF